MLAQSLAISCTSRPSCSASARERRFPRATREMLRVISHQVSVSLQNARMYRAMEERATTDGLTGLTNHRAFRERLGQIHALAERTGRGAADPLPDEEPLRAGGCRFAFAQMGQQGLGEGEWPQVVGRKRRVPALRGSCRPRVLHAGIVQQSHQR